MNNQYLFLGIVFIFFLDRANPGDCSSLFVLHRVMGLPTPLREQLTLDLNDEWSTGKEKTDINKRESESIIEWVKIWGHMPNLLLEIKRNEAVVYDMALVH